MDNRFLLLPVLLALCFAAIAKADPPEEGSGILATSVRDFNLGIWVPGIPIDLYQKREHGPPHWDLIAQNVTNSGGKIPVVVRDEDFPVGEYRLVFYTSDYFTSRNLTTFYPYDEVQFEKVESDQGVTLLVPILISQYGYTSYRGSLA